MLSVKAPAKINLFLEVTGRRPDGYHNLATVFAKLAVHDKLSFKKSPLPGISIKISGGPVPGLKDQSDNIVYKAAAAFFKAFRLEPAVEIKLHKSLPVGAGLGGGSSDAASTLLGLCRLYGLSRSGNLRKLMKLAAALGSDVPFFLLESSMAAGTGRGEKLKPIVFKGKAPAVVLVYPGVPVYTKEVYGRLQPVPEPEIKARLSDFRGLVRALERGALKPGCLFNRLEEAVLPVQPRVRLAKKRLEKLGADEVLMSGSGSTVFALVRGVKKARAIASAAGRNAGYRIFLTKFC